MLMNSYIPILHELRAAESIPQICAAIPYPWLWQGRTTALNASFQPSAHKAYQK